MPAVRSAVSWNSSLQLAHNLSNIHTWAMFFLRHLANMSFMVPFWASTNSGSVPIWGAPHLKPRHPEEVVYSLNDSCSHFTQRLFPPKVPQQHTKTIPMLHKKSFILIIHHIHAHIYIFYFTCLYSKLHFFFFRSSWQAGCPRLLVSDTWSMAGGALGHDSLIFPSTHRLSWANRRFLVDGARHLVLAQLCMEHWLFGKVFIVHSV